MIKLLSYITEDFLAYLETDVQLLETTINNYRGVVKEYNIFLKQRNLNVKISTHKYIIWLIDQKKNKRSTINNKISMIKRYIKYLTMHNIVTENQYIELKRIKHQVVKQVPKFYHYAILKRSYLIVENSNDFNDTEKLIIFLILNHGTTVNELLSIKFNDIDWKEKSIYIQSNKRQRILYLQNKDLLFLTRYILNKRGKIDVKKSFILLQNSGVPYKKNVIINAINKLSKYLNTKITLTGLRNTFIMYLIDIGMDMIYIKNYLGLKSLTSISRFEYINQTYIKDTQKMINKLRITADTTICKDNIARNIFNPEYQYAKLTHNKGKSISKIQ